MSPMQIFGFKNNKKFIFIKNLLHPLNLESDIFLIAANGPICFTGMEQSWEKATRPSPEI